MGIASDLRQSVLQAAMQGKLTMQKAEDGDARDLLLAIRAEKEKLVKEKKGKKEKPLAPIAENEIPFAIPENWVWIRLGNYTEIARGGSPRPIKNYLTSGKDGINWIKIGDTDKNGKYISKTAEKIIREGISKSRYVKKGSFLLSNSMSFGRPYILNIDGCIHDGWLVLSNYEKLLNCDYLYYVLSSPSLKRQFVHQADGAVVKNLNTVKVQKIVIPLPPLPEQRRIVARVDALMKEIDKLEQTEKELEAIKAAFPADMKASLLQAAMEGKLTEQKAEDGDARGLLLAIREEKEKLVKEKKIKKEKPLTPITDEEIPFDIPENWVWCRLGDLVFNHGQKKPDKTFSYIDVGTLDNVNHKLNKKENILEGKNAPSRARKIVKEGDVLYSTVRPYLHNICVIDRSFSHEPIASTAFAVMSCLDGLCNKYLYWSLLSPYFDAYANDPANSKGVAYPAINDTTFYNAIIPLPPLAEQHRIVEKLDQLLPLCDSLSEH